MLREYWSYAYLAVGICLLTLGVVGTPYYVGFLFSTENLVPLLIIFLGIISTLYCVSEKARVSLTHYSMILIGVVMIFLPAVVFMAPNSFGLSPASVQIGDAVALTLGGILLSIVSMEQPYKETVITFSIQDYFPKLQLRKRWQQHRSLFELLAFRAKTEP